MLVVKTLMRMLASHMRMFIDADTTQPANVHCGRLGSMAHVLGFQLPTQENHTQSRAPGFSHTGPLCFMPLFSPPYFQCLGFHKHTQTQTPWLFNIPCLQKYFYWDQLLWQLKMELVYIAVLKIFSTMSQLTYDYVYYPKCEGTLWI